VPRDLDYSFLRGLYISNNPDFFVDNNSINRIHPISFLNDIEIKLLSSYCYTKVYLLARVSAPIAELVDPALVGEGRARPSALEVHLLLLRISLRVGDTVLNHMAETTD